MRRALLALLVAIAILFARPPLGRAQGRGNLTAQVDATTVGVGDDVHLTLQATSEGADGPTDPQLGAVQGFKVVGSSSGPTTSISITNGRMTQRRGLNVTWTLRANKIGHYTLGPASVVINGARSNAPSVQITVVAAGRAPQRPQPTDPFGMPMSPFDPFKGLFGAFDDQAAAPEPQIQTDPRLALDAPRGATAFLHATIDKTQAVVGEQVTLTVNLYLDMSERDPDITDVHEATANDFLKRSFFEDDSTARPAGNALINGRPWAVKLVRKSALFPLKAGDLEIGPMSLSIVRGRTGGDSHRESETLHVRVGEPPVSGRPPGYVLGDVGNFALSADVVPRDVERDGAIGVTVDLSGTGNLPEKITPPVRAGIEWLDPQVHEKMGAQGDRFGGKRTFSFVVRMHKEGPVDLGDLTLPFYNPDSRTYGVARATLGKVNVRPGAAPPAMEMAFDPFAGMPVPRTVRAGAKAEGAHLTDSPLFWLSLGAAPLAYAVFAGARAAAESLRKRRAERKSSPETELKERVAAAERACDSADAKAAYAAIVRALETATIARAGVNVRDAQKREVAGRLEGQGVDAAAAARFEELLAACETARFAPDVTAIEGVRARWKEAKDAIGALRRAT